MDNWNFPKFEGLTVFLNELSTSISAFRATYFDTIRESITGALTAISDRFAELAKSLSEWSRPYRAIEKLAENQYVYWDYLDDEFIDTILQSHNINKTMRELNSKQNYAEIKAIASKCFQSPRITSYHKIFSQSMTAFENGDTDLALLGFISIIDGLLSDVSNKITATNIYSRANPILEKLENSEVIEDSEYAELALLITFRNSMELLGANSKFDQEEPKNLNRHWIMHGRSRRRKTKLDCVKMIRFIYGIILIDEFSRKEAELHNE